eukprot:TRINITY_DN14703_c0_g1_i1.p2 TRINITY_DN14703_c0_g1~~TRINITY_DN14703_c0_g1_i1.p2  ORF type:complete len:223 (-),score=53.67 TRINITY_DN14703_c0_g1_i1:56-724(-)
MAITQCAHLEVLDLAGNTIGRVPDAIGNLRRLKQLSVSECALTEVSSALWSLENLERLGLDQNVLLDSLPALVASKVQSRRLAVLDVSGTSVSLLPVWLASLPALQSLGCSGCPIVGVAANDATLVTFAELAGEMSAAGDPKEIEELSGRFSEMLERDPLRLLRVVQMHFAPRTPLRELCVAECAALRSTMDFARLPAHIQDEIARAGGGAEARARKRARAE